MRLLFVLILSYLLISPSFAQVSEGIKTMSQGDKNALTLTITQVDNKRAKSLWEDYLKKFGGKVDYSRKSKEYTAINSTVTSISPSTIDIYSTVVKSGGASEINAWFFLGGAFLSSKDQPAQYQATVEFMNNFTIEIQKYLTGEALKNAQKALEDQQSQYNRLVKDQKGWEKDIEKAQADIEKWKKSIEKSKTDQATKLTDIEKAKTEVDKVKNDLSKLNN